MAGCCLQGCNIISMLGFLYFGLNFLIFDVQKNFYQFHIEDAESTKISMGIASGVYLLLFVITYVVILRDDKKKLNDEGPKKNLQSIHQNPKVLGSFEKQNKIKQTKKGYTKMQQEEI